MSGTANLESQLERDAAADLTEQVRSAIQEVKRLWNSGEPVNAMAAIEKYPELQDVKAFVLELAYEEFCRRIDAGESISATHFCQKFSRFRGSLGHLLEVHRLLEENPELLASDQSWPPVGSDYLGFRLVRELGRGAFSRVYLARELAVGNRPVAVKVSNGSFDEAGTLGKLRHPNIVPIHHVQRDPDTGQTIICMPFLGKVTLADFMDRIFQDESPAGTNPLAGEVLETLETNDVPELAEVPTGNEDLAKARSREECALCLGIQLSKALAYAHGKQIVHHDLKPSNVLITASGKAMLLDFNLSFDPQLEGCSPGGTLPYMAPEQIERAILHVDRAPQPDARSDLYSLGVVLYEFVFGQLPFDVPQSRQTLAEVGAEFLRCQRAGMPGVSADHRKLTPEFWRLIESCLSYEPDRRPASAEELGVALQQHWELLQRRRRRGRFLRRFLRGAAVLGLLFALGVLGYAATLPPAEVREHEAARAAFGASQFHEAIEHADRVLAIDSKHVKSLALRAKAAAKLGDFQSAIADYDAVLAVAPSPTAFAGKGYCLAQLKQFPAASKCLHDAATHGLRTATVLNDLGHCLLRCGAIHEAYEAFSEAIRIDPDLQAAYCNRALLALNDGQHDSRRSVASALEDIRQAIAIGPESGELFYYAAVLNCKHPPLNGRQIEETATLVKRAIQLGLNPDTLRRNYDFSRIARDPKLVEVLQSKVGPSDKFRCVRLVELP